MSSLSRRVFLTGLAAAGLTGAAVRSAWSQAFPQSFSSFAVDVSVLKAKGLGPFADLIAAATLDQLRASFGDRLDPRGPRLVVRLTGLFQTPFSDSGVGRLWGDSGGGSDSLDGEVLAVDRRGQVLALFPQHLALAVNRSATTPDEPGRAIDLAHDYVLWLRRRLIV